MLVVFYHRYRILITFPVILESFFFICLIRMSPLLGSMRAGRVDCPCITVA